MTRLRLRVRPVVSFRVRPFRSLRLVFRVRP